MRPDSWLFTRMLSGTLSVVPRKLTLSTVPLLPASSQASPAASVLVAILSQVVPVLYQNELLVVSYTSKPFVLGIDCRAVASIRGMSNPLLPDLISRIALGFASEPSALTARFWLQVASTGNTHASTNKQ